MKEEAKAQVEEPEVEKNIEATTDDQIEVEVTKNDPEEEEKKEEVKDKKEEKKSKKDKAKDKINKLEAALDQKDDLYLRLQAEFDNYRRRTLKEKMELTKSAGESLLLNLLPVMDDFERALQSMEETEEANAIKEGIDLIYKRFGEFLSQNGVKEIDAKEKEFDTDMHEAITKIPAPTDKLKGKVVDVIQKGYFLNDKVIRYSKVVIGE